jgi:ABC-type transporter MlaC component
VGFSIQGGKVMNTTLQEVRELSTLIRNNDSDSGTHYLLGYVWASLTEKQKKEIEKSFRQQLKEKENK